MEVQVQNLLSTVFTIVGNETVTGLINTKFAGNLLNEWGHLRHCFTIDTLKILHMLFGNDKHMDRCFGIEVVEGEKLVILMHGIVGDLSLDNFAEYTHGSFPFYRAVYALNFGNYSTLNPLVSNFSLESRQLLCDKWSIMENLEAKILQTDSLEALEKVRIELFGKKGVLAAQFAKMKDIPGPEKKAFAEGLNKQKAVLQALFDKRYEELKAEEIERLLKAEAIDVSLYSTLAQKGALHPVMETMDKIIDYFTALNFSVETGGMIEDDFHNFEALNLPKYHPARDMQDTFYFKDGGLLRTHTSPVQIRTMLKEKPPIRMIAPGAVFRRDYDVTHTPMFHQVEGLVVDEKGKVSFANLKAILTDFLQYMFGDVDVRFRPSFFPFTEPSAEVDISCIFCGGEGCRVCSHTGWIEILGCGIVDPNVFKAVDYKDVSGYAFGLGVERIAMLMHKIPDLRSLFEGDIRLLEQFR